VAAGFSGSSAQQLQRVADRFVFLENLVQDFHKRLPSRMEPGATAGTESSSGVGQQQQPAASPQAEPKPEPTGAVQSPNKTSPVRVPEPDFADARDTAVYYMRVLETYKRLRVEPYDIRRKLVERAWEYLEQEKRYVPIWELLDVLNEYQKYNGLGVYPKGIEKMLHTLFIARCFEVEGEVFSFDLSLNVMPASGVDAEMAVTMMNETYVRGLVMAVPDIHLDTDGLACFLMGEITDESRDKARQIASRVKPFYDAPTAMEEAFRKAKTQDA